MLKSKLSHSGWIENVSVVVKPNHISEVQQRRTYSGRLPLPPPPPGTTFNKGVLLPPPVYYGI